MSARLTIPAPCPADWERMTPVAGGRYCGSCQKVVVDFTRMSEAEIVAWLGRHGRACGRFRPEQLARPAAPRGWAAWLAATAVAVGGCESAPTPPVGEVTLRTPPVAQAADLRVSGQIVDQETGQPVAGAYVTSLADSTVQARSNAAGRFSLRIPQHLRDSLLYVAASTDSSIYIGKRVPLAAELRITLRPLTAYALGESILTLEPGETMQPHALRAKTPPVRVSTIKFMPPTPAK